MDDRELGRLEAKVDMLLTEVSVIKTSLASNYVTRKEFEQLANGWQKYAAVGAVIISGVALFWQVIQVK